MEYHPITVTELNRYVKQKVESDEMLANVLVQGEISNFKHHYTGHLYFTLKDENSLIKCVMFKTYTDKLDFEPKDGMKIMVLGTVSVFERDGIYQIYAKAMKQDGMGDLYAEYEALKKKLETEGLFAEEHKMKIPYMPKCIGVITSKTGSVIRDIINVSTRRNPNVYIKLFPVPVQGGGASNKIAEAIEKMNEQKLADVIILARGGGSLEDLWPFNEEIVARAIFHSEIPIISAIGHETDFTIADFVADLRAPTPSSAAELAVADIEEVKLKLQSYLVRNKQALKRKVQIMKLRYEKCMNSRVFKDPTKKINEYAMILDAKMKNLENLIENKVKEQKLVLAKSMSKLDALSPLKTLARGYSIAEKEGKVVKSAKELKTGDKITLQFADNKKEANIL